jgi:hypothetical protein
VNIPVTDPGAARRAQSLSVRAAAATAVVPTALAAQGMVMVGRDALGLNLVFAFALAAFLELALISSALLARAAAMAGRPAGADGAAVWVFSTVSGLFSAAHELIGHPDPATGQRGWQHDSLSLLAAGVRLAAPLVAAWLWERVLVSARRQAAARTAAQIRADRRLLAFARAAQTLRRLLNSQTATEHQIQRARRRFDHRHVALLRRVPATDPQLRATIQQWLTELFSADTLYLNWTPPIFQSLPDKASDKLAVVADSPDSQAHRTDTSTRAAGTVSDTVSAISVGVADNPVTTSPATVKMTDRGNGTDHLIGHVSATLANASESTHNVSYTAQTLVNSTRQASDTMLSAVSNTPSHSLNVADNAQALTGQSRQTSNTAARTPAWSGAAPDKLSNSPATVPDKVADTSDTCPNAFANVPDTLASDRKRLSAAVEIVRTYGPLSGSDMAKQMSLCGHPMSERTGLRWRDRAEEHQQQHQTLTHAD